MGWLRTCGIEIKGRVNDICIADTLIDEERADGYSLEALAQRWLGLGKDETVLRAAAENWGIDAKKDLWKLPAHLAGAYGEADPVRTLAIWQKQKPVLRTERLWPAYELERELTPILFEMFWRGIRVDLPYAEELNARWLLRERELKAGLKGLDIWSAAQIARICDEEKIKYGYTKTTKNFPKGQPSITKAFMEGCSHPKIKQIQEVRAINRVRDTYLEQNLIRNTINGRIHPQYIQMASDDGGTRTMRLACRNPNAQQFPKRSTLFDAKALRQALLPEEGADWAKFDYWSQEPVIQCHYGLQAKLPGASEVRDQFLKGIKLYTFIEQATKGKCNYDQAKAVALARTYGQGKYSMAEGLRIPVAEADDLIVSFDEIVPYIATLSESVSAMANNRGSIRTLAGHKRHFNYWEVPKRDRDDPKCDYSPLLLDAAVSKWPKKQLVRAWVYKAFNALCQGGAAGQTKKALVMINRTVGLPMMTVHDEISKSVYTEKETKLIDEIMVNCIPLLAPVRVDMDLGKSWC